MIKIYNEKIQQKISLKIVKSTKYPAYSKVYTRLINFNYRQFLKTLLSSNEEKEQKLRCKNYLFFIT